MLGETPGPGMGSNPLGKASIGREWVRRECGSRAEMMRIF